MTQMVERVAKRIARSIPVEGSRWCTGHGEKFPKEYHATERKLIRGISRDAIEAIREPTPAMLKAGSESKGWFTVGEEEAGLCWKAMIDAALKESA